MVNDQLGLRSIHSQMSYQLCDIMYVMAWSVDRGFLGLRSWCDSSWVITSQPSTSGWIIVMIQSHSSVKPTEEGVYLCLHTTIPVTE